MNNRTLEKIQNKTATTFSPTFGRKSSGRTFMPEHGGGYCDVSSRRPRHNFGDVQVVSPSFKQTRYLGLSGRTNCLLRGTCHTCVPRVQTKLRIGQPGDKCEQEADRVAEQVMRMPEPQVQRKGCSACKDVDEEEQIQTKPFVSKITPLVQRQTVEDEEELISEGDEEDEAVQTKQDQGQPSRVSPEATSSIQSLRGGGQPLHEATRAYFEPRFCYNFSGVRLHHDCRAFRIAKALNAKAFTMGQNVVFGRGRYAPGTERGRMLLAHELAHVIQQKTGSASRHIQRDSITYRQITWGDFKGSVPAGSSLGSVTSSGPDIPKWKPKRTVTDTRKPCRLKNRKTTEYRVKYWVDPAVFDKTRALMIQEKSWARKKYKEPKTYCVEVVPMCKREIGKQAGAATQACRKQIKPCREEFNKGATSYSIPVEGTTIKVTNKKDCSTKLVKNCEKAMAKRHLFELKDRKKPVAKAKTKAECGGKKFKDDCDKYFTHWSPLILKHEQGHFDISHVIAGKARSDLKASASKFFAAATACGKRGANEEAVKKFDALKARDKLGDRGQAWIKLGKRAEQDYDDQTDHGVKQKEQASWEKDIKSGLKAYELTHVVQQTSGTVQATGLPGRIQWDPEQEEQPEPTGVVDRILLGENLRAHPKPGTHRQNVQAISMALREVRNYFASEGWKLDAATFNDSFSRDARVLLNVASFGGPPRSQRSLDNQVTVLQRVYMVAKTIIRERLNNQPEFNRDLDLAFLEALESLRVSVRKIGAPGEALKELDEARAKTRRMEKKP